MKITRISETKRGRFAVFCENEFLFSVDGETLLKSNLNEGSSITQEELFSLKEESDTRKAKDQALRYLSLRAYAQQELYQKLCLKYDPHSAAAAIAAMEEFGLLDDETFAVEKAKGLASRGKSSVEIRRKLQELGIDRGLIEIALQQAECEDAEVALALVRKMYQEKLRRGENEKVMAALARRGFAYPDIRDAVSLVCQELQEE